MSGSRVKETMEQIHMPDEMQEQIILQVEKQLKSQKRRAGKRGRLAAAAAVMLAICLLGIPVHAGIRSFVMARMEKLREEELENLVRVVEARNAEADSFSREFSDSEKERMTRLWQSYAEGRYPKKTIRLVENGEEMQEGTLYYVVETGYFNLPEREMTDEELLQMIDFNKTRNYALSQTQAGQEARREQLEEQEKLRKRVEAAGGISREKAVAIAEAQMASRFGTRAGGMEYVYMSLYGMTEEDCAREPHVIYVVVLPREDGGVYVCRIDSTDGSILEAGIGLPYARNILDE